jgi:hypothetical protein
MAKRKYEGTYQSMRNNGLSVRVVYLPEDRLYCLLFSDDRFRLLPSRKVADYLCDNAFYL